MNEDKLNLDWITWFSVTFQIAFGDTQFAVSIYPLNLLSWYYDRVHGKDYDVVMLVLGPLVIRTSQGKP